jgi:hypothetical protein
MSFELKRVWSTIGVPTFQTAEDFNMAQHLAGMSPYNLRWDVAPDGSPYIQHYTRLYGNKAAELLEQSRQAGQGNGLLVVSNRKDWVFPDAVYIQADPMPEPQPGPDEEIVKTPWGDFIRKKAAKVGGLTTADVEQIAARVVRDTLKALGIIVA